MFELTEDQVKILEEFKLDMNKDNDYADWHNGQIESSKTIRDILRKTGFAEGQDLSLNQLYELGDLASKGLGNIALGMRGKSSMFEANDIKTFNSKLRNLLFSEGTITHRVDAFLDLKFVGTQTVSQFLCKFAPEKHPFFAGYMNKVFAYLSIGEPQRSSARSQALKEFGLGLETRHDRTSEYFENYVILREIKTRLGLKDYLETQNLLWTIFKQRVRTAEENRAPTTAEEETMQEIVDISQFIESVDLAKANKETAKGSDYRLKKTDTEPVSNIISFCEDTSWVLPHFQRYFTWKKDDICTFLRAVFKKFYVGSFLFWHAGGEPQVGVQPIKGIFSDQELKSDLVILDGQQRITSLYYGISAPKNSKSFEDKSLWEDTKIYRDHPIYFYIDFNTFISDPDSEYLIKSYHKKLEKEECFERLLFPLYELDKYDEWLYNFEMFLRTRSNNTSKISEIRENMRRSLCYMWSEYKIPIVTLPKGMGIGQVTEIFEQLNTKGVPLSVFDLLIAKLYQFGIALKDLWDETTEKYPAISRYQKQIDKTRVYLLQAISLYYDKSSTAKKAEILKIYENIYKDNDKGYRFEDHWVEFSAYMNKAIGQLENLRDGFGVKDEKSLPYDSMIPVLTALLKLIDLQENKAECNKKLEKWYWSSVFTNAYSQAADSQMTADFKEVKAWFSDDTKVPKNVSAMSTLLPSMNLLEIESEWNSKYRGVMSLLALKGAKDFATNKTLEFARDNDKDHLFPKSKTYGFGSAPNVNSVLNITWMSKETNREIKRVQKPSEYLPFFRDTKYNGDEAEFREVLKTHLINDEAYNHLLKNDFASFLIERDKEIKLELGSRLGIQDLKAESFMISPKTPYSNKKAVWNLLKSCEGYIHWVDKYFSKAGLELLSESIESKNAQEIKILMAYDKGKDYESLRRLFKDFKEECSHNGITCELRMITESKTKNEFHDRWIISENECYNVPSTDVIARGQVSEIKKTLNRPPFEKWWKDSKDIVTNWDEITRN